MDEPFCDWVRDRIPGRAAGRLPSGEKEAVEEHLGLCDACRTEAVLIGELHGARPAPAPEGRDRVRRAVLAGSERAAGPMYAGAGGRRMGRRPFVAGGVAAAAVAALTSLWILPGNGPGNELAPVPGDGWEELVSGEVPDDWVVANDPVLTELPEEALEHLLQELDE